MEMKSYASIIRDELEKRIRIRPQYSLRAFARDVQIEISMLSRVMNGKQNLSTTTAKIIAEKLFATDEEKSSFVNLVEFQTTKKQAVRELALKKLSQNKSNYAPAPLLVEAFRVISEWHHLAILDASELHPLPKTAKDFSHLLGITELQAKLALERLESLELIERSKDGWKKTSVSLVIPSGPKSDAVRRFHIQMIEKALEAAVNNDFHQRYLRSDTLAIRGKDIPEIRALMDEFSERIQKIAARPGSKTELY
jgi:uncharacterized protein (TIGR02147 family)